MSKVRVARSYHRVETDAGRSRAWVEWKNQFLSHDLGLTGYGEDSCEVQILTARNRKE